MANRNKTAPTFKPRDPAAHLRSQGALRQRVRADKRRRTGRKAKHRQQEA